VQTMRRFPVNPEMGHDSPYSPAMLTLALM
jgi:hypothetical protein